MKDEQLENEKVVQTTVFDFSGNPKNAALYFDHIMPLDMDFLTRYVIPGQVEEPDYSIEELLDDSLYRKRYEESFTKPYMPPMLYSVFPNSMRSEAVIAQAYNELLVGAVIQFKQDKSAEEYYRKIGYDALDMNSFVKKYNINEYTFLYEHNGNPNCEESYNTTLLELAQISLVDTSRSEWEQIIQFREDKDSVNKLRRLKLFFHNNYAGKDKNYIEYDLLQRIEDYNEVVKDWGFETLLSSLTLLSTGISTIGASLALALTGQPIETAFFSGICVGIGNMSLHFAKEKKKLSILQRDHPLAYIIGAKKKLES